MVYPSSDNQPFRSASEFPKTIQGRDPQEAEELYAQMRAYLVSTNRSQGQLRRYNNQYREQALAYQHEIRELQNTRDRLQVAIQSLAQEKSEILQVKGETIQLLQSELGHMTGQIESLSSAFQAIRDFDDPTANWGSPNLMTRIRRFLRAANQFFAWWNREERSLSQTSTALPESKPKQENVPPPSVLRNDFQDRQNNPQLFSDRASVNRSLLEDS